MLGSVVLFTLFASAFLAATLLPAQSELSLAYMLANGQGPLWLLLTVATLGNTLGSVVNWLLGRWAMRYADRKWFPVGPAARARAEAWYRRYGRWSLLLSWAPVIGDPLTLVAGLLREPFIPFVTLVGAAKLARYLAVAGLTLSFTS